MNLTDIFHPIIEYIKQNLTQFIVQSHAVVLNNACQTIFFMLFTIQMVSWILKKINLFCADQISNSKTIKILIFILFSYLKVWDDWNFLLEIFGYFCSIAISIQLYSGCMRKGKQICRLDRQMFSNIYLVISILIMIFSYKIFNLNENKIEEVTYKEYSYIAVYFFTAFLLIILGMIRKKQLIYSLIIIFVVSFIIVIRYLTQKILNETFLKSTNLPLQSCFYIFFALHQSFQQKKQQYQLKIIKRQIDPYYYKRFWPSQFTIAETYYFMFFLFNKRFFPIQMVFISASLISYVCPNNINKK